MMMKSVILAILIAVLTSATTLSYSEKMDCVPLESGTSYLNNQQGELMVLAGFSAQAGVVALYVNPETRSYSFVRVIGKSMCLIDSGLKIITAKEIDKIFY